MNETQPVRPEGAAAPPRFVSESIEPERGAFSTGPMSRGLAALPRAFRWRGRRYEIVECLGEEKVSKPEGHTEHGERYLRRQEFTVRLDSGETARLYVIRQAPAGAGRRAAKKRWFLYTISSSEGRGP